MINATFVMEQHIGHGTFYKNLRHSLDGTPKVDLQWVEVTYSASGGFWERWSAIPSHIRGTLSGRRQVHSGLRQRNSDVVFFNTQVPAALGGGLVRKQPYILCTDITPIQYDQMSEQYGHQPDRNPILRYYKHRVNTRLLQRAERVVPWSTWTRTSLIEDYGVDPGRIHVIAPGVDTALWHPISRESDEQRPVRILFIGGDFHRKGGDGLVRAFRSLPSGSAELVLVTRTDVAEESDITVRNDLQANSPELIALVQSSDIFALPTKGEAFGIAATEASAAGLPVVATAVGGLTDIVQDEQTGFLVPPGDEDALATRLAQLVNHAGLRQQMGRAARHHVETHFDARKNAARILQLIQETAVR